MEVKWIVFEFFPDVLGINASALVALTAPVRCFASEECPVPGFYRTRIRRMIAPVLIGDHKPYNFLTVFRRERLRSPLAKVLGDFFDFLLL